MRAVQKQDFENSTLRSIIGSNPLFTKCLRKVKNSCRQLGRFAVRAIEYVKLQLDPLTLGSHTQSAKDAPAILARHLESLPRNVSETRRVPIGRFRGLQFGILLRPHFPPEV